MGRKDYYGEEGKKKRKVVFPGVKNASESAFCIHQIDYRDQLQMDSYRANLAHQICIGLNFIISARSNDALK